MPIYEYKREDGTIIEAIQKFSDPPLTECPETRQKLVRIMSESAFHLKGSGWYKTDYTSSGKDGAKSSDKSSDETKAATCGSEACATGCAAE